MNYRMQHHLKTDSFVNSARG